MKWILILTFYAGNWNGGVAFDHIPFADHEACMVALRGIKGPFGEARYDRVVGFCAPVATPAEGGKE